jgi:hypothetical protein
MRNIVSITVYKQEKVAEKAYRLLIDQTECDCEDDGQAQRLCGLWLGTSGEDSESESESEEESSASSEMSDHVSPVPDDTHSEYILYSVLCKLPQS